MNEEKIILEKSESPINLNKEKTTENDIKLNFGVSNGLKLKHNQEIIDDAISALNNIQRFTEKSIKIDEQKLDEICKTLSLYKDPKKFSGIGEMRQRDGNKKFDSNNSNLTFDMATSYPYTYISELQKYILPGSKSADLFCGSPRANGSHSSVSGSVFLHSLLGVDKILEVDLFHQRNIYQKNDDSDEFNQEIVNRNYHYYDPKSDLRKLSKGRHYDQDFNYIPVIDVVHTKMDALQTLQVIPDNSLDSVMINNIDDIIVEDKDYLNELRKELQRVVKSKGIIFGWSSYNIWYTVKADVMYGKDNKFGGLQIIQNTKS